MTRTPTTTWKAVNRRYFASTSGTLHPATYQSKRYSPTIKNQHAADGDAEHESQSTLLVRAGFVRQSSSGIWSFLPNGLRVIKKIQSIVSKEMERIRALFSLSLFCFPRWTHTHLFFFLPLTSIRRHRNFNAAFTDTKAMGKIRKMEPSRP
jgi:hypothetical protein